MLKYIFKIFFAGFLIASIFFSIGYFYVSSFAESNLQNTFIPSESAIAAKNAEAAVVNGDYAAKVYDEFTEATIDKTGFYLRVDKVNLFKRIIKDVDPFHLEVYKQSWNYGVSHGKGTSYPDKIGITYLFSHATGNKGDALNQNAWFSNLDQLVIGDQVIIYYEGKKYFYEVSQIRAVAPTAGGFYTGASAVAMTRLQYCGPPTGSLDARTLVDAILIDTQSL